MDKLYFAVRKMDKSVEDSRLILDELEQTIAAERGATVQARMMKYYLATTGMEVNAACDEIEKKIEDDDIVDDEDDFVDEDDLPLPDDLKESDDDSSDDEEIEEGETEGVRIINFWKARSKKLRHGMAISAWMCSPVDKIMQDAKEHHTGLERDATTELFKKWFCHEVQVCLFDFFMISYCFI
jgi:hypothetical protein